MITRRVLLLTVPASLAGARLLAAQQPTFRVGAQNVPVYVTVTDANKRLVPGLTQEDFEVFDEKTKSPITIFDNQIQPVTVAVMLDSSGSMTMNLELLKQAAEQFVIRLLPEDKGRIGYFNDKIAFLSDFSSDRDMLIASLRDMQFGNPTRLYDSLLFSLDEL
jgi:VWFA-related protein